MGQPKQKKITEKEILQRKAEALLDDAIKITLEIEPQKFSERVLMFFKLIPKKRVFEITGATTRTMIKISKLILDINYKKMPADSSDQLVWAYDSIVNNMELSVKIIATAIHNKNSEYPKYYESAILDNCEAVDHQEIVFRIMKKLDLFTFMNTITSIRKMTILQESPQEPDELIATEENNTISGEDLESLSNIFALASAK